MSASNKSAASRVAGNSLAYVLVNILPYLTAFLTLPIYTRYLSPEEFGLVMLVTALGSLVGTGISFQLSAALPRLYFDCDEPGIKALFSTVFYSVAIIGMAFLVALSLLGELMVDIIFPKTNAGYFPYFFIGLVSVYLGQLSAVVNRLLVVQERASVVLKRTLIVLPVSVSVGIISVALLDMGVVGVLLATLVSGVVALVINSIVVRKFFIKKWEYHVFVESWKYSWPIIPHSLGGYLFMYSDVLVMEKMLPLALIGIYSISDKFSQILKLVVNSITEALNPNFMRIACDSEQRAVESFVRVINSWFLVVLVVYLFLSLLSEEIIFLFTTEKYYLASAFVPVLASSYLFRGFYVFSSYPLFYKKDTKKIPLITLTAGLVNIALNIMFIPLFGLWAVVGSTVASFALTAIIAQYLSNKHHFSMKYDVKFIGVVGFFALVTLFLGLSIDFGNIVLNMFAKSCLVIVFFMGVYTSNFHNVRYHLGIVIGPILARFSR